MAKKEPKEVEKEEEVKEEQQQEVMFDAMPASTFSYGLGELMVMEDLENRIFYLDDEIDADTFRSVTMFIIKKNVEDAGLPIEDRVPIKLVINCYGGDVFNGLGLVDVIRNSDTPVLLL